MIEKQLRLVIQNKKLPLLLLIKNILFKKNYFFFLCLFYHCICKPLFIKKAIQFLSVFAAPIDLLSLIFQGIINIYAYRSFTPFGLPKKDCIQIPIYTDYINLLLLLPPPANRGKREKLVMPLDSLNGNLFINSRKKLWHFCMDIS